MRFRQPLFTLSPRACPGLDPGAYRGRETDISFALGLSKGACRSFVHPEPVEGSLSKDGGP